MRSGTYLVSELLEKYLKIKPIMELSEINLDKINFTFGSNKPNIYFSHWEGITKFNPNQIETFNNIIKNRDLYVIFLDRKDFNEQLLSRVLLNNQADLNKKCRIKKIDLLKEYKFLNKIKNQYNPDLVRLTIHEKLYYEDILLNGLIIKGKFIRTKAIKNKKNRSKQECISNYDQVQTWLNSLSGENND